MKTLLTHRQGITARYQMPPGVPSTDVEVDPRSLIEETVRDYISQLTPDQIAVVTTLGAADSIPSEMDRVLLATCRTQLSRYLEADESDHMRSYFKLQLATTAQGGK